MPNPFGFAVAVPPQRQAAYKSQNTTAPFGFAPPKSKMERTAEILAPYVTGPWNAMTDLMTTPLPVLLGGGSQKDQEQLAANGFTLGTTVMGGGSVVPKPSNALNMGIRAFHGSPHSFDKFSMDKIGTGEGAQAYGHGLYFAENESVSRGYKNNLSYKHLKDRFLDELPQDADFADVEELMAQGYFTPDQTKFLTELRNNDWLGFDYPSQAITAATRGKLDNYDPTPELMDAANKLGSMYEVNINADPNAFLDWDKPLSEQPEVVRSTLTSFGVIKNIDKMKSRAEMLRQAGQNDAANEIEASLPHYEKMLSQTGDELHQRMFREARHELGGQGGAKTYMAQVAEKLREAGIPGIKYLDAGSRGKGVAQVQVMYKGKPHGDPIPVQAWNQVDQLTNDYKAKGYDVEVQDLGTRNYVVFDDKLISIIRKYGIAGASAMLGYNILNGMDQAQAEELKRIEGNQ